MKWSDVPSILGLLFIFGPWLTAVVDILSYMYFAIQISGVDWRSGRGGLMALWPLFCLLVMAPFSD